MAVNVSTITSVCLYCKTNSDDVARDFHEIYDEVGLELQLPTLVEKFFHIKAKNNSSKQLCDECVNRLIELYDLEEHAKEETSKATNFEISKTVDIDSVLIKTEELEGSDKTTIKTPEEIKKEKNVSCFENEAWKPTEETHASFQNMSNADNLIQNDHQYTLYKHDTIKCTKLSRKHDTEHCDHRRREKLNDLDYENIASVEDITDKSKSVPFTQEHIQEDNDINTNFQENFIIRDDSDVTQDFNTITSSSPIDTASEFIEDHGERAMDVEIIASRNINNIEEYKTKENPFKNSLKYCQPCENEKIDSNHDDHNSFIEENVFKECGLQNGLPVIDKNNLQSEEFMDLDTEDLYVEEIEDTYYEEDSHMNDEIDCKNEMTNVENNNINSNLKIKNIHKTLSVLSDSGETQNLFDVTEDIDINQIIEKDHDEVSNGTLTFEEEYLIEEVSCSEEYDHVDLNEYLDRVLVTNFEDLQLNWKSQCKLCRRNYNTLKDLLKHSCIRVFKKKQQFYCIIKNCEENINDLQTLARHLVFIHYNKLESLSIYGKCPDCQKSFSNIIDFNKHSCCRSIKRKAGSPNYCEYCDMDFQSLKRYVFHMQFHFTNHRPKICLLCGELFKNSNQFFEHTQYQHIPKTSMACVKCDRFFKNKDVYDSHIELHEEAKYQYSCTVCPKKYTNKFGLNQHMNIYHSDKSNVLKCVHCEKEFVNKTSYRNHVQSHATDVHVESFICSTCGIITNDSEFIKHHIESDKNSPCFSSSIEEKTLGLCYTCENCSLDFLTIKQLKQHRLSKSHSDDLFHCAICREVFNSLRHMRNHSINHKEFKEWQAAFPIKRFFVCNIGDCQEFYPIWASLYYHKKRPHNTEENEFKCQFCKQLCPSKMSLAVHVARSHNNSNVKCSYCKRSFKNQKILQAHIDKYHTPVECEVCLKKFKHRRNLDSHNNLVHLNLKRYFCKHCEKGYFHKSERDIHETKVHPEVSYKCDICNFKTNYSKSLEIHMDKHNNQLKFKCTICDKAFGRKQLLQCHLKRHLNKKDYSCAKFLQENSCDASFFTYNLLKRHIETKHQNSKYNINMQKKKQREKTCSEPFEVLQIEKISYEIMNCEYSSSNENAKTSSFIRLDDVDLEQDAIELVLENDAPN